MPLNVIVLAHVVMVCRCDVNIVAKNNYRFHLKRISTKYPGYTKLVDRCIEIGFDTADAEIIVAANMDGRSFATFVTVGKWRERIIEMLMRSVPELRSQMRDETPSTTNDNTVDDDTDFDDELNEDEIFERMIGEWEDAGIREMERSFRPR